jgi:thymidine kinase
MDGKGGYLGLILGPMFSGKTTRLIQIYKTHTYIKKRVCVINYAADTRYSDTKLSTHDKIMIPCHFTNDLYDQWTNPEAPYYHELHAANTILINEGQFFGRLKDVVLDMVDNSHKEVHICGLDGDFKRQPFGDILQLIPYCNALEKLSALCADCCDGTPAIFSHRISAEVEQQVIGYANYSPLCRECYLSKTA